MTPPSSRRQTKAMAGPTADGWLTGDGAGQRLREGTAAVDRAPATRPGGAMLLLQENSTLEKENAAPA
jgi:hypothetical protein